VNIELLGRGLPKTDLRRASGARRRGPSRESARMPYTSSQDKKASGAIFVHRTCSQEFQPTSKRWGHWIILFLEKEKIVHACDQILAIIMWKRNKSRGEEIDGWTFMANVDKEPDLNRGQQTVPGLKDKRKRTQSSPRKRSSPNFQDPFLPEERTTVRSQQILMQTN